MIDYHCHILPGLDDGCRDVAESLEMARLLCEAGFTCVHCTPHCITGLFDYSAEQVRQAVGELQTALDDAGIALQLKAGMEYFVDELFFSRLDDPLTLGDSKLLLFEISPTAGFNQLKEAVFRIRCQGLIPLLAHPERYPKMMPGKKSARFLHRLIHNTPASDALFSDNFPSIVTEIMDMGCLLQGNYGSFSGVYGQEVQCVAQLHQKQGHYKYFGTDGHRCRQLKKSLCGVKQICHVDNVVQSIKGAR